MGIRHDVLVLALSEILRSIDKVNVPIGPVFLKNDDCRWDAGIEDIGRKTDHCINSPFFQQGRAMVPSALPRKRTQHEEGRSP